MERRRLVILAEGSLDFHHGKTATSILRYSPEDVVAVVDSANAGRTTQDVLGIGGDIPIVAAFDDALRYAPTALLLGIAPRGGGLPEEWRPQILSAISHNAEIINGLHSMLADDAEYVAAARKHNVRLIDVRRPPEGLHVAEHRTPRTGSHVITFVGSDCAVGKMTAALEVVKAAREHGLAAAFVATGQTGIMLEGSGISIDRVIGDFMAGAAEQMVLEASATADWIFVEGQGSLLHPGYSGVTLALLHGSAPDAMILVHRATLTHIEEYSVPIPPLPDLIAIYEQAAGWVKPATVVAVALNTRDLDDVAARQAIQDAQQSVGIPVTDPVRYGAGALVDAVTGHFASLASDSRNRESARA